MPYTFRGMDRVYYKNRKEAKDDLGQHLFNKYLANGDLLICDEEGYIIPYTKKNFVKKEENKIGYVDVGGILNGLFRKDEKK